MARVVVGIDVGSVRKGFHAVALRKNQCLSHIDSRDAKSIADWCYALDACMIGIDAPCRWSLTGRARPAERELRAVGIHSFATPTREVAGKKEFYQWMLNGAELYRHIEPRYQLLNGSDAASGRSCFETFPHAIVCALAGEVVSCKRKSFVRRNALRDEGIASAALTNIDMIDAALCALVANRLLTGHVRTYGEAGEGFIVVPS